MRHGFQVSHNGFAGDILTNGKGDLGLGFPEFCGFDDLARRNHIDFFVFDFDADSRFARDRRFYTDALGFHVQSDIISQVLDAADFNAAVRMNLIAGNGRSLRNVRDLGVDIEALESFFQAHGLLTQYVHIFCRLALAAVQKVDWREFVIVADDCIIKIITLEHAFSSFLLAQFLRSILIASYDQPITCSFFIFLLTAFAALLDLCLSRLTVYSNAVEIQIVFGFLCRIAFCNIAHDLLLARRKLVPAFFFEATQLSFQLLAFRSRTFFSPLFALDQTALAADLQIVKEAGHRRIDQQQQTDEYDDEGQNVKSGNADPLNEIAANKHTKHTAVFQSDAAGKVFAKAYKGFAGARRQEPPCVDQHDHQVNDNQQDDGFDADVDGLSCKQQDAVKDEAVRQQVCSKSEDAFQSFSDHESCLACHVRLQSNDQEYAERYDDDPEDLIADDGSGLLLGFQFLDPLLRSGAGGFTFVFTAGRSSRSTFLFSHL